MDTISRTQSTELPKVDRDTGEAWPLESIVKILSARTDMRVFFK